MNATQSGGCTCGGVRYRATGPTRPVIAGQCGQCRRSNGYYVAAETVPRAAVEIFGPIAWYALDSQTRRGFCPRCGSTLFWEDLSRDRLAILVGTLDAAPRPRLATAPDLAEREGYDVLSELRGAADGGGSARTIG